MITRRGFLAALAAAFVADPERLLWVPGQKKIFLPPVKVHGPLLDQITAITLQHLHREVLHDNFFIDDVWRNLLKAYEGESISGGTSIQQAFEPQRQLAPGLVLRYNTPRGRRQGSTRYES